MNTREIARRIVWMRKLLNRAMVAELVDDTELYDKMVREFETLQSQLPLHVIWKGGTERRVVAPARRKVEREGIVAQSQTSSHTHVFHRFDGGLYLCTITPCAYAYVAPDVHERRGSLTS